MTQADSSSKKPESAQNSRNGQAAEESARLIEDFDALSEYLASVSGKGQELVRTYFARSATAPAQFAAGKESADPRDRKSVV